MTFASTFRLLLRHWLVIGLVTLLAGAAVYAVSQTRAPQYTATASEYFAVSAGNSAAELAQGSNYLQDQMASYGELATSPAVLNPVIDDLGLALSVKQLGRTVRVTTPRNTVVMEIAVTTANPQQAATIANSIGSQLTNAVDSIGAKLPNGKALVTVQSIQTALPPTVQSSPNTRRDTGLGLLIGLLLACGVVLGRARLDSRVATAESAAEITEEPVLATIRRAGNLNKRGLAVVRDPRSRSAEDFRQLRSSVERLADGRSSYVVAVTSSIRNEGRSTVAANLAAALGEAGHRCVLVEADLRQPRLAEITGTTSEPGLLGAVQTPGDLATHLQTVEQGSFDVLTAGGNATNPSEVLSSAGLASLVTELRQKYDFVVVDTPAILAVADAKTLRSALDGAVVVVDATSVRRPQLTSALQAADLGGLPVVGLVLNEVAEHNLAPTTGYPAERRSRANRGSSKTQVWS